MGQICLIYAIAANRKLCHEYVKKSKKDGCHMWQLRYVSCIDHSFLVHGHGCLVKILSNHYFILEALDPIGDS